MPQPARPTKTAKVTVVLPEGLPEKDEDANEQSLPFLAVEVEIRTADDRGGRIVTGLAMSVLLHAARGLHLELGGDPPDLPGEVPMSPGQH